MALFRNKQWEVTAFGLESIAPAPPYEIAAASLCDMVVVHDRHLYEWPLHMSDKNWLDLPAFNEAFGQALRIHGSRFVPPPNDAVLQETIAASVRMRAQT